MSMNKKGKRKTSFGLIAGDQKKSIIIVWTDFNSDLYLQNIWGFLYSDFYSPLLSLMGTKF